VNVVRPVAVTVPESASMCAPTEFPASTDAVKPGVEVVTVRLASFTGRPASRTSPSPDLRPPKSGVA